MSFRIEPYTKTNLITLLTISSLADYQVLEDDQHVQFLDRYLTSIGARTILHENSYVDRDFLEDYASYYVRCFPDYDRKCCRLHFFRDDLSAEEFNAILAEPTDAKIRKLRESYLGFVVIKKLPLTIIGRTCLLTYEETDGRKFPTVHSYRIHLFGIPLELRSLAFQEQDQVAAACATSCLWSIFHATGKLFQHPIPSPFEITRAATAHMPTQTRVFPNHALDVAHMAQAIKHVGLEPYFISVLNQDYVLKSTVHAYARAGIPLALVAYLVDTSTNPHQVDDVQHAMTVCGYRIADVPPAPVGTTGFLALSSSIDKLYCHDDQIGPFAKMEFNQPNVVVNGNNFGSLSTSWKGKDNIPGSKRAVANLILVPLYHKIRIPLAQIEKSILAFDSLVEQFRLNNAVHHPERLVWDIFLQEQNDFKKETLAESALDGLLRTEIVTSKMPRFIWRARALSGNNPIVDIIFDATDIAQSGCFHNKVIYDKRFSDDLKNLLQLQLIRDKVNSTPASHIFKSFI